MTTPTTDKTSKTYLSPYSVWLREVTTAYVVDETTFVANLGSTVEAQRVRWEKHLEKKAVKMWDNASNAERVALRAAFYATVPQEDKAAINAAIAAAKPARKGKGGKSEAQVIATTVAAQLEEQAAAHPTDSPAKTRKAAALKPRKASSIVPKLQADVAEAIEAAAPVEPVADTVA